MRRYLKYIFSAETLYPMLIALVICFIAIGFFSARVKGFKEVRKKFLYYSLINILVTALFFLMVYNLKQTTVMFRYITLQGFFIISGSIHVYLYKTMFKSLQTKKIHIEIIFALIASLFLTIPIALLIAVNNDFIYLYDFFITLVAFIFPTLTYILYTTSISIPAAIYDKWYYPLTKKYNIASINEFKNMIVLNLYFYKDDNEPHLTKFKVKAPKDMNFGRLFYFFINEYNEKNTSQKIKILDKGKDPYGWCFYSKPKWYSQTKRIDSELTVENNNLRDNDSVICQRIIEEETNLEASKK